MQANRTVTDFPADDIGTHGRGFYRTGSTSVNRPVGLSERPVAGNADRNALQVYPNPATDIVKVQLENHNAATVQMLDVTGRVVAEKETTTGETEINTASLAQGMYIISVQQNGMVSNHKIIVN